VRTVEHDQRRLIAHRQRSAESHRHLQQRRVSSGEAVTKKGATNQVTVGMGCSDARVAAEFAPPPPEEGVGRLLGRASASDLTAFAPPACRGVSRLRLVPSPAAAAAGWETERVRGEEPKYVNRAAEHTAEGRGQSPLGNSTSVRD
jgi:hypothetical protein